VRGKRGRVANEESYTPGAPRFSGEGEGRASPQKALQREDPRKGEKGPHGEGERGWILRGQKKKKGEKTPSERQKEEKRGEVHPPADRKKKKRRRWRKKEMDKIVWEKGSLVH